MRKTKDDLFSLITKMYNGKLYPIERVKNEHYDTYRSEYGVEYLFEIDGFKYGIGYERVVEDGEDWAQTEAYTLDWIHKYNEEGRIIEYVDPNVMWGLLIINRRDYLIDSL